MKRVSVKLGIVGAITIGTLFLLALYGWVANIFKFFFMLDAGVTAMFIARIIGMFVAPLGSVLGFM